MLYVIVCYYKPECEGSFTIDYIFRDKRLAISALVQYEKEANVESRIFWPKLFYYNHKYIPIGEVNNYHVYLNDKSKNMYIFLQKTDLVGMQYCVVPLPPISTKLPENMF